MLLNRQLFFWSECKVLGLKFHCCESWPVAEYCEVELADHYHSQLPTITNNNKTAGETAHQPDESDWRGAECEGVKQFDGQAHALPQSLNQNGCAAVEVHVDVVAVVAVVALHSAVRRFLFTNFGSSN